MSSILTNFVAVRSTKGDILNPAQYRSAVEMIQGILNKYDFKGLSQDYIKLIDHLNDFDDPHLDNKINFFDQLIAKIYPIYSVMLPNPLSLTDFTTQLVPTVGFIELLRRIVLNRYLYSQIILPNGVIPSSAFVYLTDDWGAIGIPTGKTNITLPAGLITENDFIKAGWNANTYPVPVILNAVNLSSASKLLPIIFETSSNSPFLSSDTGSGYPVLLAISSNDLTLHLTVIGIPNTSTTIFSLRNGVDTLKVIMTNDGHVQFMLNAVVLIQSSGVCSNGKIKIALSKEGYASLQTYQAGALVVQTAPFFIFTHDAPFTSGLIGIATESLTSVGFSLRELTVYEGYSDIVPPVQVITPDGFIILTDPDGAYLYDSDGTPLMDYLDFDSLLPTGYGYLTDDDGAYLKDDDGLYLIEQVMAVPEDVPDDMDLLTDADGSYLIDEDGFFVIEPIAPFGYVILRDTDGSPLIDSNGSYIIDTIAPTGYILLTDTNGVLLTDNDGSYLYDTL